MIARMLTRGAMAMGLAVAGCQPPPVQGSVTLLNVSYDPTREFYAEFNKAFAFDRPTLLSFEQGTVTVQPAERDKPTTFKGPLLREVLGHVEAAKMKITVVAVNGFSGWLMPEDVDRSDWILALEADGVPLGIGQQGPLWLINTRAEGWKPGEDGRGRWVWAVFYMRVGE